MRVRAMLLYMRIFHVEEDKKISKIVGVSQVLLSKEFFNQRYIGRMDVSAIQIVLCSQPLPTWIQKLGLEIKILNALGFIHSLLVMTTVLYYHRAGFIYDRGDGVYGDLETLFLHQSRCHL